MATLPHFQLRNTPGVLTPPEVLHLAAAFAEFISASARLENSYGALQLEVEQLSRELVERNAALKLSLAENERVHRSLEQIVNSMPCGVLVVNQDGSVERINPECRRLLELSDPSCMDLGSLSREAHIDLQSFLPGREFGEEEREFRRETERGRQWIAVRERRLANVADTGHDGRRDQTVLILRDTTVHKQAELERERARRATALSEVATTLAHEIRNPLASLELFAGLIAEGGEGTAEWVAHLHAGIRSLSGTVNNVLSFHGAGFLPVSDLDLIDTIGGCVDFCRPIAEQAGVQLSFLSALPELRLQANSSALQQIVLNLVSNAVRHTPKGGSIQVGISVGTWRDQSFDEVVTISFADTGCGIAEAQLTEIFHPGFSGSGMSVGLGLAVCEQVARQHEGSIRVKSAVGVGTTFFVELPIR